MTTAITMNSATTIALPRKQSIDQESDPVLHAITRQLGNVTNTETPLRLKIDSSGHARIKPLPEKPSFLARIFSADRYAREAGRASRYFGLTGQVTIGMALSKTKPLTAPLFQPTWKSPKAMTDTELTERLGRMSGLDGAMLLQLDQKGNVRTARPDTPRTSIDLASEALSLKGAPTVAKLRSLIGAQLNKVAVDSPPLGNHGRPRRS